MEANGAYGMGLTRTYRSRGAGGMFGNRWLSTYDHPRLVATGCARHTDYPNLCLPTSVQMTLPDGSTYTYTSPALYNFTYKVSNSAAMGTMSYDPVGGYIVNTTSTLYRYSPGGVIQSVTNRGGVTLLAYTYGSNSTFPSRVTNAAGRYIDFTYDANLMVTKATDAAGNAWAYQYQNVNLLKSVTSPGASPDVRTYFYEATTIDPNLLTGIAINGVRYSTYKYYTDKRVQESGLTGGEERDTFVYGTNTTTATDARGQSTTYTFTPAQGALKLSSVSRAATSTCAAAAATTVYDASGWVDYTLDWSGNKSDFSYDSAGRLLSLTTAQGTAAAITQVNTWTGDNLTETTFKDAAGVAFSKATYTYVASGAATNYLASQIMADLRVGGTRTMTYSYTFYASKVMATRTVTESLPNSQTNVTTTNYDTLGNIVSVVNGLGHTVSRSAYNALGQPGRMTDANGISTDFAYDAKGNLISSTQVLPTGSRGTTFAYNNNRQVTDVTYPSGAVARYRYDAATKLVLVGNAQSEFVQLPFDIPTITATTKSARNVPTVSGATPVASAAGEFVSTTKLDSLGRPYTGSGNNGQLVNYRYDKNGNLLTRSDAAGRVTTYTYDAQDRIKTVTAPDTGLTQYAYTSEGNLASVTDARGLTTSYSYNGLSQVTQRVSPDTGTTGYAYDSAGRLVTETRANGLVISYTWDVLGRMTSRASGGVTESFTYDGGPYAKGRLTGLADATGSTSYSYNADGQLAQQVSTVFGTAYTTGYTYNAAGQLVGMSYPSGLSLGYQYDATGRLSRITSNLTAWPTLADSFCTSRPPRRATPGASATTCRARSRRTAMAG
jgi:YD repeat-containing protein